MKVLCSPVLLALCLAACTRTASVPETTTVDIKGQAGIEFTGYLIGADGKSIDIKGTTPWRFTHTLARVSSGGTNSRDEKSDGNGIQISEVVAKNSSAGLIDIAKLKVSRTKGEGLLRVSIGNSGKLVFDAEQADPKEDIVYSKP